MPAQDLLFQHIEADARDPADRAGETPVDDFVAEPEGFEDLEIWLADWVLPDSAARARKRQESTIEEIRAFYEAMLARAPRALELLSARSLGELDPAAENLLNTKRTKYASFFNRVRNAVAQHWHPEVIHAARDPHGKIYGNKTRTTRLRISLNQDGSVHRIWVDRPSGVDYLDEEAIRSVRAAAPFTNPPKQLVDAETGYIDFSFNFILMIDGSKRIFRYKR